MKGLLIKDFRFMKNQKQFFVMTVFLCAIFSVMFESPSFVICYLPVMVSVFSVSTIGYDEQESGLSYLFTLPVSRSGYIKEKYLFGILTTLCSILVIVPVCNVILLVRKIESEPGEILGTALAAFAISMLMHAVMVPIQIRFEAEKSRTAVLIATGCIYLLVFLAMKAVQISDVNVDDAVTRIVAAGPVIATAVCAAAVVILVGISFLISLHFIKNKEF